MVTCAGMVSFKSSLVLAVVLVLFGACSGDPCTDGSTCCSDCETQCAGNTIACYGNCKSPCYDGADCGKVGVQVAQGVAVAACAQTKSDCGVGPFERVSPPKPSSLDLAQCCKVVIGSCQGNAANIPCKTESYGSCSEGVFNKKYQDYVASKCRDAICLDEACKNALQGYPGC